MSLSYRFRYEQSWMILFKDFYYSSAFIDLTTRDKLALMLSRNTPVSWVVQQLAKHRIL